MQNFNYHTHTYRCGHADLIEDEEYIKEWDLKGLHLLTIAQKKK